MLAWPSKSLRPAAVMTRIGQEAVPSGQSELTDRTHDAQLEARGPKRLHEKRERETVGGGQPEHPKTPSQNIKPYGAEEFPFRKNDRVGLFWRMVHACGNRSYRTHGTYRMLLP